ncbi:hypothetical protein ACFYNN_13095 [Streptomyces sp. NPDC006978]|uniref:hypothetical protein n=1 Tax=Streptomyces sp. NPDC006978 TaxID=3364769 RepID=UPI00369A17A9
MSTEPIVVTTALGPYVAAFTARLDERLVAVVNTQVRADPVMHTQAAFALLCAGIDAAQTMGALNGVRS